MTTLNTAQKEAVLHGDGPSLVLAGAGSGKTRVIVERIAHLVADQGVDQRNILALTFTNKAAEEMRTRVAARLGVEKIGCWLGTFHSFGLYILRREIDKLGRPKAFTIFDDADQLSLMKKLIKDAGNQAANISPRDALSWVSRQKQDVAEPDLGPQSIPLENAYRLLWQKYHAALERAGGVDFDDLLVLTARLFEQHPEVRQRYADRYRYVMIDEYQDTNRAQYLLARHLSSVHANIFVVGDEDQSIYSWRGATIRNILDFEQDFPNARVFRLEQNYRSMEPILKAANAVVARNKSRLGKTLWSSHPGGDPVRLYDAADAEAEARFVADDIVEKKLSPGQVAVLFRTNGQVRLVEESLRRKGLAYVVIGGVRFYGRKEIKDVLAYLRLLVNPADDVSLRRVLNVPARGIGATSQDTLEAYALQRQQTLLDVMREVDLDQSLTGRARHAILDFVHLIDDLSLMAKTEPVATVLDALLERTKYREFVQQADEKDYRTRLEMVDEFQAACAQYDAKGGGGLLAFLQELSLLSDVDQWDPSMPAVTLMTCHSAKGLEFDHVYLLGLEEGLLPHASALESEDEIEEERRLCYVAMTRARKSLTLCAARSRMTYGGGPADRQISRFVGEVPRDQLQLVGTANLGGRQAQPAADRVTSSGGIKLGTRVWHAQFGKGTVMYTSGSGAKLRAKIRFESGRSRDFMVAMTPLKVLDGEKKR
ncbi:MAG TPA: UvrD-helicase domain-containing protein [Candidatus Hydrogenedentes bacterium]|nr:UvrD-helicase domain-containing protein [Candidatus Hydrogenedentota bacterium]